MSDDDRLPPVDAVRYHDPDIAGEVTIGGRRVPHLKATVSGSGVHLILDDRYGLDLPLDRADDITSFIADAIAIGMGYTCHPRESMEDPIPLPPFRRVHMVEGFTTEEHS